MSASFLLPEIILYVAVNWVASAKFDQRGKVLVGGSSACEAFYPDLFRIFALDYSGI